MAGGGTTILPNKFRLLASILSISIIRSDLVCMVAMVAFDALMVWADNIPSSIVRCLRREGRSMRLRSVAGTSTPANATHSRKKFILQGKNGRGK